MANYSITPILFIFSSMSKENFTAFAHFLQVEETALKMPPILYSRGAAFLFIFEVAEFFFSVKTRMACPTLKSG